MLLSLLLLLLLFAKSGSLPLRPPPPSISIAESEKMWGWMGKAIALLPTGVDMIWGARWEWKHVALSAKSNEFDWEQEVICFTNMRFQFLLEVLLGQPETYWRDSRNEIGFSNIPGWIKNYTDAWRRLEGAEGKTNPKEDLAENSNTFSDYIRINQQGL